MIYSYKNFDVDLTFASIKFKYHVKYNFILPLVPFPLTHFMGFNTMARIGLKKNCSAHEIFLALCERSI